jgi:hypothetical protein
MNTQNQPQGKTHLPTPTALWSAGRDQLHARRQARAERRQLQRDLATYTSQADLADLLAVLDRYDDSETAQVRSILSGQMLSGQMLSGQMLSGQLTRVA